jgi:DNA-binding NarL/FixJ family response regulator
MSDGDTVTIVLADDHEVVRAGLRLLLDAGGRGVLWRDTAVS